MDLLWMHEREQSYALDPGYLARHPDLDKHRRCNFVRFLLRYGAQHNLNRETVYKSIYYVDAYLSKTVDVVCNHGLETITITALWMSLKIEEGGTAKLDTLLQQTATTRSAREIHTMEFTMGQTLEWKLLPATPYAFVKHYLHPDVKVNMSRLMQPIDLAYMDVDCLSFRPSELAATAIDLVLGYENTSSCCKMWIRFTLKVFPVDVDTGDIQTYVAGWFAFMKDHLAQN